MNGITRRLLASIPTLTRIRLIVLEHLLLAAECAAFGAMVGWAAGGDTGYQVAVGGLVGSLVAVVIGSMTAVEALPDSLVFAMLCFLLWLVFVLPLLVVPLAVGWWLRSLQNVQLKAKGRYITADELQRRLKTGEGTLIAETDDCWVRRLWWTKQRVPDHAGLPRDGDLKPRRPCKALDRARAKALLADVSPQNATKLAREFPMARIVRAGCSP